MTQKCVKVVCVIVDLMESIQTKMFATNVS